MGVVGPGGGHRQLPVAAQLTLSGRGIPSAVKRVDPLRRQARLPRELVIAAMMGCFRRRYGLAEGGLTHVELEAARELAQAKFRSGEWAARLP